MDNNTDYKVCSICGSLVDNNNIFNIKGEEICRTCVEKKLEQKQSFSPIGTFMCSLVPGLGQIFLGKKKKGIFLLGSFILSFFVFFGAMIMQDIFYSFFPFNIIAIGISILAPVYAIVNYVYSFFDANITRRFIENDVYVDDIIDKLAEKTLKNKKGKKYIEEKVIDKRLQ